MKPFTISLGFAAMASTVAGHGYLVSPKPGMPGSAMKAACGQTIFSMFSSDINGNPQGALQNPGSDYDAVKCGIWMCKGMQFEDNKANIQALTPGQKLKMEANIAAPHTGIANVSITDVASGAMIGEPLITWSEYASTSTGVKNDQKNFEVTIPSDVGTKCSNEGACVLKWWWDSRQVDQTYMACVDITIGGSSGGPAPSSMLSPISSPSATILTSAASKTPVTAPDSESAILSKTESAIVPSKTDCSALPKKFTVQELIAFLRG